MRKFHIKKGDIVFVNAGKYKGKTGRVLMMDTKNERAIVEGCNIVTRRTKPSAKHPQGGMIKQEAPIHVSNLNPVDPVTKKPTRVRRQLNEAGKLERVSVSGNKL